MMILRWESSSGNYRTPSSCPSCAQFLAAAKTISFFLAFFSGERILLCNCNATMQGHIPVAVCGGARSLPVSATASA